MNGCEEYKEGVTPFKTLLEEQKIEETIDRIPQNSFTVLDFIQVFETLYQTDWKRLKERFGQFGEKRRYTVNTYLSNDSTSTLKNPILYCVPLFDIVKENSRTGEGPPKKSRNILAVHGFLYSRRNNAVG